LRIQEQENALARKKAKKEALLRVHKEGLTLVKDELENHEEK